MDVLLRQLGDDVELYIEENIVTVFKNKSVTSAVEWVEKNFSNTVIHIAE